MIGALVIIGAIFLLMGVFGKNKQNVNTNTQTNQQNTAPLGTGEVSNVDLTSSGFNPKTLTIKTGTRIIWFNKTGSDASVNSDDHPTNKLYPELNLGLFPNGSTVQLVLIKPGTYTYHNYLKPEQKGTIIVE